MTKDGGSFGDTLSPNDPPSSFPPASAKLLISRERHPKEYDQATQLLRDLHVIAQREDDVTAFTGRVRELRTRYAERPSLMDRLDKAGLP
jgi:hypothetical protein